MRRLNAAATIIVAAAVVGLADWSERAYHRWGEQQHPFAAGRLERARTTCRDRRALVTELARGIRG